MFSENDLLCNIIKVPIYADGLTNITLTRLGNNVTNIWTMLFVVRR